MNAALANRTAHLNWKAPRKPRKTRPGTLLVTLIKATDGTALRAALAAYEATGDHDHGRGPIGDGWRVTAAESPKSTRQTPNGAYWREVLVTAPHPELPPYYGRHARRTISETEVQLALRASIGAAEKSGNGRAWVTAWISPGAARALLVWRHPAYRFARDDAWLYAASKGTAATET